MLLARKYKKYNIYEKAVIEASREHNQRIKDAVDNMKIYEGTPGGQLALARKKLGLTQKELSERTGISQKQISEYENNDVTPLKENMDKLLQVLDVNFQSNKQLCESRFERINLDHALLVLNNALGIAKDYKGTDTFKLISGGRLPEDVIVGLEYAIEKLEEEQRKF